MLLLHDFDAFEEELLTVKVESGEVRKVHAWSEFLFVSLLLIFNSFSQINNFYYLTSLLGLQDVENHCAHLRNIELSTGRKVPYLRFPHVLFPIQLDWRA